jgi:hypothetical protein
MRAILPLVLLGAMLAPGGAHAKADKCKICRDYHAACIKAHTKEACGSELNICLKHCREPK